MSQPTEQPDKAAIEPVTSDTELIIVDDDPLFSLMLQDYLLTADNLGSELFDNGTDFLSKYKHDDNRKIILDYEFDNGLNGLEILKKLKNINPLARVIIVSGVDDLEQALETLRHGASDYFLKSNKTVFANILCSLKRLKDLDQMKWN